MAVALLTPFYGVLLAVAAYCAAVVIARRRPVTAAAENMTAGVVPAAGVAVTVGTLVVLLAFGFLLTALSQG